MNKWNDKSQKLKNHNCAVYQCDSRMKLVPKLEHGNLTLTLMSEYVDVELYTKSVVAIIRRGQAASDPPFFRSLAIAPTLTLGVLGTDLLVARLKSALPMQTMLADTFDIKDERVRDEVVCQIRDCSRFRKFSTLPYDLQYLVVRAYVNSYNCPTSLIDIVEPLLSYDARKTIREVVQKTLTARIDEVYASGHDILDWSTTIREYETWLELISRSYHDKIEPFHNIIMADHIRNELRDLERHLPSHLARFIVAEAFGFGKWLDR